MEKNLILILLLVSLATIVVGTSMKQPHSVWNEMAKSYKNKQSESTGFLHHQKSDSLKASSEYTEYWFTQTVDHFSFASPAQTFQQRYLIRKNFWNEKKKGPIFFYCGNEGPIEMFYDNSGFLNNDLAQHFGAMVVYMEHRYFGESWPFGSEQDSFEQQNLVYLNANQALADFSKFLFWLKDSENCQNCPIIAFGGSYGGMLASWFRMKYPNVVWGSVAMSAPIYYFQNREGLNLEAFYSLATNNYRQNNSTNATQAIREAYRRLDELIAGGGNAFNYSNINAGFQLCTPIYNATGALAVRTWMDNAFLYMAMLNYPYPTQFLKNLPGWPCNVSATYLNGVNQSTEDYNLFKAIREATNVYYNWQQNVSCIEVFEDASSDQDMSGWDILACGDMVMPMQADGVNDMFSPFKWDDASYSDSCFKQYGIRPNYNWTLEFFGGRNDKEMQGFSNIFFSNGMLDPWSGGSPVEYLSRSLDTEYISMAAHHLDLRSPNALDPESVVKARQHEIDAIQSWLNEFNEATITSNRQSLEL